MPTPYPYINFFIILIQPAFLYCCLVLNYFQVATWSLFWTFKKNAVYKDKFKGETKNYAWLRINTHKIIFLFLKIICAKLEFGLNLLFHIIWLEIFMSVNILQRNMTYCFILSIWSIYNASLNKVKTPHTAHPENTPQVWESEGKKSIRISTTFPSALIGR